MRFNVTRVLFPALALFAPALLAAGCSERAPAPASKAAPVAVSTARAETTALTSSFEAGGVVRARATAVVSSRLMAPIVDVHVRPGDRVRKGSVLVTLDSREVDANRARAAATLASTADAVQAAQAQVRTAQAALTLARTTHDRIKSLHEKRSATLQELDQAVSTLETAEAQLGQAQAHLAAANAGRDAAQAASDAAAVASSYAALTAPFDGIVAERSVDPGSMANPGAGLLTVEDATGFRLESAVDEARAVQIADGQSVDVVIGDAAEPADAVAGRVSEIARIDPASHSFLVKIDLPARANIRSGTFGRARFAGPSRQALVVPSSSAVRRGQLTFVFTVDADHRARLQAVSPGAVAEGRLEILAGLREGDVVITNPSPSLSDGTPVSGGPR